MRVEVALVPWLRRSLSPPGIDDTDLLGLTPLVRAAVGLVLGALTGVAVASVLPGPQRVERRPLSRKKAIESSADRNVP